MEAQDRLSRDGAADPQRTLVLIGLGYLGLVGLALYLDYKIQMRRARKRREARETGYTETERERFKRGEDDPSERR